MVNSQWSWWRCERCIDPEVALRLGWRSQELHIVALSTVTTQKQCPGCNNCSFENTPAGFCWMCLTVIKKLQLVRKRMALIPSTQVTCTRTRIFTWRQIPMRGGKPPYLSTIWAHRSNKGLSARKRVEVLSTFQTEVKNFFFKKTFNKKYCDVQLNKAHLFCYINFLPW